MKGALTDHAKMSDKVHRDALVEVEIRRGIPVQIREMREARGWSQGQLGELIGKPQNNISRMENTRDTYLSIKTLVEIASAFDVGLLVKFVPFSEVLRWTDNHSLDTVVPKSYSEEVKEEANGCRVSVPAITRISQREPQGVIPAYSMRVFWSDEDGAFIAVCPEFHGLSAFGPTYEDAVRELRVAIGLAAQAMIEEGEALPEPVIPYIGPLRVQAGEEMQQLSDKPAQK